MGMGMRMNMGNSMGQNRSGVAREAPIGSMPPPFSPECIWRFPSPLPRARTPFQGRLIRRSSMLQGRRACPRSPWTSCEEKRA